MKQITNSELQSAIKRINQRLVDFEQSGWTDSEQYDTLISAVNRLSQGARTTKRGYSAIGVTPTTATPLDRELIMKYGAPSPHTGTRFTRGGARETARKEWEQIHGQKLTKGHEDELKHIASENKRVHDFIKRHAEDIYKVSELSQAVHRSTKLTPEERGNLLHMYDNPEFLDNNGEFVGDNEEVEESILQQGQVKPNGNNKKRKRKK